MGGVLQAIGVCVPGEVPVLGGCWAFLGCHGAISSWPIPSPDFRNRKNRRKNIKSVDNILSDIQSAPVSGQLFPTVSELVIP